MIMERENNNSTWIFEMDENSSMMPAIKAELEP
jgi:hypothetical protein